MPILEIITIGTELLLGEIQDTNSTHIARTLRDYGIDIYRINTIGDNPGRIAAALREAMSRADIVITTGGLGPTVDDPTRGAVAEATERPLMFQTALWEDIKERFKAYGHEPTDNNKRQAFIPKGALPVHNPVGTAPCFIVEGADSCVISLPGVPHEMEQILNDAILPFLIKKYDLQTQTIKAVVLHTASMGESTIDDIIGDLETYSNPTVGLLAHPGQIDIRVTCKAASEAEALQKMEPVLETLKSRLGENIYGRDEETLETITQKMLEEADLSLCLVHHGLSGRLAARLQELHSLRIKPIALPEAPNAMGPLQERLARACRQTNSEIGLGIILQISENKIEILIAYRDPENTQTKVRSYGGPVGYASRWSTNTGLDFLRRNLTAFLKAK
jgi:nicotinamide-nucleotide amidase